MRQSRPSTRLPAAEAELAIRQIRDELGISREQMACLLDVSTGTIARWEARAELPARLATQSRLQELDRIIDLGLIVYGAQAFRQFLTLPMPSFDGRTALQLLEESDTDRLYGALAADYEGQGY